MNVLFVACETFLTSICPFFYFLLACMFHLGFSDLDLKQCTEWNQGTRYSVLSFCDLAFFVLLFLTSLIIIKLLMPPLLRVYLWTSSST